MAALPTSRSFVTSLINSIHSSPSPKDQRISNPLRDAPHEIHQALLTLHVLFPNELLPALDLLDRGLVTRLKLKPNNQDAAHQQEDATKARPGLHLQPRRGHDLLPNQIARPPPIPQPQGQLLQEDPQSELHRQLRHVPELPSLRHLQRENPLQVDEPLETSPPHPLRRQEPHQHGHQSGDREGQTLDHGRSASGPTSSAAAVAEHAQVFLVRSAHRPAHGVARVAPANLSYAHRTPTWEVRLDAWSCSCPAFAFAAFPAKSNGQAHQPLNSHSLESSHNRNSWAVGGLTQGTDMPICKHLLACVLVAHANVFRHLADEKEVSLEELAGWAAGWGD